MVDEKRMAFVFGQDGNIMRPAPKISEECTGNVAFKCTYNDMKFRAPCSEKTYMLNKKIKKAWCSDYENKCREYVGKKIDKDTFPCYESALFVNWEYSSGVGLKEKRADKPFAMKNVIPGKIALLTTRRPLDSEANRYVFGFFHIKRVKERPNEPTTGREAYFVEADQSKSLEIDSRINIRFWDFHRNPNNPESMHWGTGLFRYISDKEILEFMRKLREEYIKIGNDDHIKIIDYHIGRYYGVVELVKG